MYLAGKCKFTQAIENYRKALEIDPSNKKIKELLKDYEELKKWS